MCCIAGGGGGVAGINNEALYSKTYAGTKALIEEFIEEVVAGLDFVFNHSHSEPDYTSPVRRTVSPVAQDSDYKGHLQWLTSESTEFGESSATASGGGGTYATRSCLLSPAATHYAEHKQVNTL
jgi:hypothetical protein